MRVQLKGIDTFVNQVGDYTFKIESFSDDGFHTDGSQKFKLKMRGWIIGDTSTIFVWQPTFFTSGNLSFLMEHLGVALKSPANVDVEDWVGRYVNATIGIKKEYTDEKYKFETKIWTYSTLNDKLEPIPECLEDNENNGAAESSIPEIEISEDSIPF